MINVGIVDYGAGNIASVEKAIDYAGGEPKLIQFPDQLKECDKIILPGVGAATKALDQIRKSSLDEALEEAVISKGKSFLGICLGMQILADRLYEFGESSGLGWIGGEVVHISTLLEENVRVPHMGWNTVFFEDNKQSFFESLGKKNEYYFAHSYTFCVKNNDHIF